MLNFQANPGEGQGPFNVLLPALPDLIWSAVVFLIVGVFFWRYVTPRFTQVLDEREDKIEGGIARAEKAEAEAARQRDEQERILREAHDEAAAVREQARVEADQIRAERKAETQAEIDRMLENAKAQIEAERQSAIAELRSDVGQLALSLASGVVGENLRDDARQDAIVDRVLGDIEASVASEFRR